MNELVLKEFNEEKLVYLYIPEGRGEPGEIEYDFVSKEAKVSLCAEESSAMYFGHAVQAVERFIEKNALPIKFTNAWY